MKKTRICLREAEVKRIVARLLSGTSKSTRITISDDRAVSGGFIVTEENER